MVKLGSMDILFIGFYIPVSYSTSNSWRKNKMKVNPQVIIQFCPQNTEGPLLLSLHHSDEAKRTIAACIMWKVTWKIGYTFNTCELLLRSSNYINITFSWCLEN